PFRNDVAHCSDLMSPAIPICVAHHSGMMSPGSEAPLLARKVPVFGSPKEGTGMPSERIAMRQVRDVIRLKSAGLAVREIARRIGVAPSTVRLTLQRLAAAGLNWPLAD